MNKERELLRRAVACLLYSGGESVMALSEEIDSFLSTPSDDAEEPVYLARRKGLEDFFTCSKDRYDELSALDLFETKIAYLHPPKPTEPEAETIETLKAENFALASGQCTEGGPWGDEGGTPYCKYAEPASRKPATDGMRNQAMEHLSGNSDMTLTLRGAFIHGWMEAEKHHGIGGDDE